MGPTIRLVVDPAAPWLDHVGVELARRRAVMRHTLVTERPSITYAFLATARGQTEAAVRRWVRRLRNDNKLITVAHGLIPSFQFDADYQVVPAVADAVAVLTGSGMSSWAVWHWFATPSPWVGVEPVQLIDGGRADDVVRLAQRFVSDSVAG